MKFGSVQALLLACIVAGVLGCGSAPNSVEKPENPVPPPKNAPQKAGTTTSAELP